MPVVDTDAKRRLLDLLKVKGPLAVSEIAQEIGVTTAAVRQHLAVLSGQGLARNVGENRPTRGRPAELWDVDAAAGALYPDRHNELTTDLLNAIKRELGDEALERVVAARARTQAPTYAALVKRAGPSLLRRVEALAERRTAEGYMAEAVAQDDGDVLLVEHHCPIADAAHTCVGLCHAELEAFRSALGRGVTVTRERHLLAGDTRCAYRVAPTGRRRAKTAGSGG